MDYINSVMRKAFFKFSNKVIIDIIFKMKRAIKIIVKFIKKWLS